MSRIPIGRCPARLFAVCAALALIIPLALPIPAAAASPPAADPPVAGGSNAAKTLVGSGTGTLERVAVSPSSTSSTAPSAKAPNRTGKPTKANAGSGSPATPRASNIAASNLQFYPLSHPIRLYDSRPGFPAYYDNGVPEVGGNTYSDIVAGASYQGVTVPTTALAVTGNITVVADQGSGPGYVTLYPDGASLPATSNANYVDGQTVPNAFTVALGDDGGFQNYVLTTINIVIDITGYYAPVGSGGLYFHKLPAPLRNLDTRPGQIACIMPGAPLTGGSGYSDLVAGLGCTIGGQGVPGNATAIAGNATVVADKNAGPGFLTLFPGGTPLPTASNNNYVNGQVIPNYFFVGLGNGGKLNLYALTTIDVVIDITGYFSPSQFDANGAGYLYNTLPYPIRMYDTRAGAVANGSACYGGFGGGFPVGNFIIPGGGAVDGTTVVCQGLTIPTSAVAVSGNATVVADLGSGPGFVTIFPAHTGRPTASNLNYVDGDVIPNFFLVGLNATTSTNGHTYTNAFDTYNSTPTDQIFDLNGYFA